jgi:translocation and assembly module TamB
MRGLTRRRAAVTSVVVLLLAAAGAWNERRTLAEGAIANALAARGVNASYRVADIGLRWERLENVVIGDPRNPDLTADWAEVRVAATIGGLKATAIRAGGVRLRGRLINGKVSFGEIDKLIPVSTGAPFTLPDLDVDLSDARIAMVTAYGDVGARLDGRGNLANGFRGKLAAIAPTLAVAGCRAGRATLYVDLAITNHMPSMKGPARVETMACGAARFDKAALSLDITLSEALDHWQGTSAVGLKALTTGARALNDVTGRLTFDGDAKETQGTATLASATASAVIARLNGLSLDAKFVARGSDFSGQGTVKAAHVAIDHNYAARLALTARSVAGTPVGPLLQRLSLATKTAGSDFSVSANLAVRGGAAILTSADVAAPSGVRLHVGGGQGVRFGGAGLSADTRATLAGGGFPTIAVMLRRSADGATSGVGEVAPYASDTARLVLRPVQFAVTAEGTGRVVTTGSLDGPLGDGRVTGLRLPIALTFNRRGDISLNPGCIDGGFQALKISSLELEPASLRLCATNNALLSFINGRVAGGTMIATPRLSGRLGGTPVTIAAHEAEVSLAGSRFKVSTLAVKLGNADRVTSLDLGTLDGSLSGGSITGKFASLSGKIGNVPLLIDSGVGNWSLDRGVLALTGAAKVSDEGKPVRFNTMAAEDVKLRLAKGRIVMTGMLREPTSHADVAAVSITHDLGRGTGRAELDVTALKFDNSLQPEKLTPLTLGVVANVVGGLSGEGLIEWTPAGVTSSGTFTTKGLDFAAAFGPVTGLSGKIVFTDLLGLVTAPGQSASIGVVNPGIPVPDGRVTYHLAPGQKIVVEGGRWPFAGGVLILDPTTLDMGVSKERRLTFRVEGLDAAKFIQQLEFENLAATGIFDGSMPMIFDDAGGRIAGGKISARPGGGTLSYVGEVSNAKLNAFAKLAFDALKSIRYNNLAIGMDGALDGEIISTVNFRGVNQAPASEKRGYFARQFSNLPFIFNITIRAPFRGLLTTARTFQDPSALLNGFSLTEPTTPTIQPPESEKRP